MWAIDLEDFRHADCSLGGQVGMRAIDMEDM
jgi:hypothetical protein